MTSAFDAEEFFRSLVAGEFDQRLREKVRNLTREQLEEVALLMAGRIEKDVANTNFQF
jgi:hypothetical protein